MNFGLLAVAGVMLASVWLWILSDVRVRTLRSVVLLAVSLLAMLAVWTWIPYFWGFALGAVIGALLALPVLLRHRLVLSLKPADADMVQKLSAIDHQLIRVGRQLRRGAISPAEYEDRLSAIHDAARRLVPADDEWAIVVHDAEAEIANTLRMVRRRRGPPTALADMQDRRAAISAKYRELVRRRARFLA